MIYEKTALIVIPFPLWVIPTPQPHGLISFKIFVFWNLSMMCLGIVLCCVVFFFNPFYCSLSYLGLWFAVITFLKFSGVIQLFILPFFFLLWFSSYTHVMILQLSQFLDVPYLFFHLSFFFLQLVAVDFYSDSLIFFSAMSVLLMNSSKKFIISVIVNV